jgi:hypothetical protein
VKSDVFVSAFINRVNLVVDPPVEFADLLTETFMAPDVLPKGSFI